MYHCLCTNSLVIFDRKNLCKLSVAFQQAEYLVPLELVLSFIHSCKTTWFLKIKLVQFLR